MRIDEPDEVDRILETALAGYSRQEPLVGLDRRVLERIAQARPRRSLGFPRWAVAIPLAACLLVGAFVWMRPRASQKQAAHAPAARPPVPSETGGPETALRSEVRAARNKRRPARGLPKLAEFPARVPVTSEERALLALAREAPEQLRAAFGDQQNKEPEPIRLLEIRIQPLLSDGNQ